MSEFICSTVHFGYYHYFVTICIRSNIAKTKNVAPRNISHEIANSQKAVPALLNVAGLSLKGGWKKITNCNL